MLNTISYDYVNSVDAIDKLCQYVYDHSMPIINSQLNAIAGTDVEYTDISDGIIYPAVYSATFMGMRKLKPELEEELDGSYEFCKPEDFVDDYLGDAGPSYGQELYDKVIELAIKKYGINITDLSEYSYGDEYL